MRSDRAYRYNSNPARWAADDGPKNAPCPSCEMSDGLRRILPSQKPQANCWSPNLGLILILALGAVFLVRSFETTSQIAAPQDLPIITPGEIEQI